jgi:hypothetical protein
LVEYGRDCRRELADALEDELLEELPPQPASTMSVAASARPIDDFPRSPITRL